MFIIKARSTEPLVLKPSLPVSLLQVLTPTRPRFLNGRLHSLLQQDRTGPHPPSRGRRSPRRWHILCDRLKPPATTWADKVRITGLYAEPFVLIALDSSLIALGRVSPHAFAFLHHYLTHSHSFTIMHGRSSQFSITMHCIRFHKYHGPSQPSSCYSLPLLHFVGVSRGKQKQR